VSDSRNDSQTTEIDEEGGTMRPEPAPVRCALCRDVIGVYEPLVIRRRSEVTLTSLAAEPDLRDADAHYHHDCHLSLDRPA
jgi:hypothetical protein